MNKFAAIFLIGVVLMATFLVNVVGFCDGVMKFLPDHREQVEPIAIMPGMQKLWMKIDQHEVQVDVYYSGRNQLAPVVIMIHGSGGITDDERFARYKRFGEELAQDGFIAMNVHYFDAPSSHWIEVIQKTIDTAQSIQQADSERIGIGGYSLGGTIGLKAASLDRRIKALAVQSGALPPGFQQSDVDQLPTTFFITGDKDNAYKSFLQLNKWFKEKNRSLYYHIQEGKDHSSSTEIFWSEWNMFRTFFRDNL